MEAYDVVVVGGGTAGVVAAVQAGRAGAPGDSPAGTGSLRAGRTLLVEKEGVLGGTMIAAAVNAPASFFAGSRQIIAGIGWELVRRTLEEAGEDVPSGAVGREANIRHITIDRALFAALADEAVEEAGVEMLFHAMPASAEHDGEAWRLELCTKTGLRPVRATVLVDCTGDANLVSLAGFEVDRPDELQPGTLVLTFSGYDAEAIDYAAIQAAFDTGVAAGRLKRSDAGWKGGSVEFLLRHYGGNRLHVVGVDGRTSEGKTRAEVQARAAMLRLYRFLRTQPGLQGFRIEFFATECGIRETVTVRGKARITIEDYEAGRVYDDAVCYSYYPVDIHCPESISGRALPPDVLPTIPLGAMVPEGSRQLIVAGRCVSGDREANSSYRVAAPCMATGQAAGAAAALAAERGCDVADVPLDALKDLLAKHGAIVPGVHELVSHQARSATG